MKKQYTLKQKILITIICLPLSLAVYQMTFAENKLLTAYNNLESNVGYHLNEEATILAINTDMVTGEEVIELLDELGLDGEEWALELMSSNLFSTFVYEDKGYTITTNMLSGTITIKK